MLFILYRVRHVVCIIKETLISCLSPSLPPHPSLFNPPTPSIPFQPSHPSHPSPLSLPMYTKRLSNIYMPPIPLFSTLPPFPSLPLPMYTKRLSNIYKCEGFFQANVNVLFTKIFYIFPLRRERNLFRSCCGIK